MNQILGIGVPEAFLILMIATAVLGPRRMIHAGFQLGRHLRLWNLRSRQFLDTLRRELSDLGR